MVVGRRGFRWSVQDEFGMTIKIEKLIEDITDAGGEGGGALKYFR